jgi:hypothetical protein
MWKIQTETKGDRLVKPVHPLICLRDPISQRSQHLLHNDFLGQGKDEVDASRPRAGYE